MDDHPLPLTIISGYLGAGKTSLVNHLLRHAGGRQIVVLVNDFGELPIDADLIDSQDGNTLNLANGCVCCSMGGDLFNALADVLDRSPRPDHLVIEASGVANPAKIANIAHAEPDLKLDGIVSLVDANSFTERLDDRLIGETLAHQLKSSNVIIINKLDLIDEKSQNQLQEIVRNIAPDAQLIEAKHAKVPIELVMGLDMPNTFSGEDHHDHSDHGTSYARWSMTFDQPINRDELEKALAALDKSILRLKGIVRFTDSNEPWIVQCVGKKFSIVPGKKPMRKSGLVAIGLAGRLDTGALDKLFCNLA